TSPFKADCWNRCSDLHSANRPQRLVYLHLSSCDKSRFVAGRMNTVNARPITRLMSSHSSTSRQFMTCRSPSIIRKISRGMVELRRLPHSDLWRHTDSEKIDLGHSSRL